MRNPLLFGRNDAANYRTTHRFLPYLALISFLPLASVVRADEEVTARRGDTLESLARKHHVSKRALARANEMEPGEKIERGDRIVIPGSEGDSKKRKGKKAKREATETRSGRAKSDGISVRKGPDEEYDRISRLEEGEEFTITRHSGDWVKVILDNGKSGWVRADLVHAGRVKRARTAAEEETPKKRVAKKAAVKSVVKAAKAEAAAQQKRVKIAREAAVKQAKVKHEEALRLAALQSEKTETARAAETEKIARLAEALKAKTDAARIAMASRPEPAEASETRLPGIPAAETRTEPGETNLALLSERDAAVSKPIGRSKKAAKPAPYPNRAGLPSRGKRPEAVAPEPNTDVVRTAYTYRGVPYSYGAMSRRATDCSGFTCQVFATKGIKLPRSAREQASVGTPVAFDSLQEGDLILFHTTRPGVSHVGIFVGEGKFVHASSGGGRVRVDTLLTGYYRKAYVGARRLLKHPDMKNLDLKNLDGNDGQ